MLDNKYYSHVDEEDMGVPLSPILANTCRCYHKTFWLKRCSKKLKPRHCKNFVDDIIVLFEKPALLQEFAANIKTQHFSIRFSVEAENTADLHFNDLELY